MNVQAFLDRYRLLPDSINADKLIDEFLSEMEKGLAGQESSLAMIPTYISAENEIPVNEPVIVIDAGGTNLRVACVSFDVDKQARIENYSIYPMPGSETEVSASTFFNRLSQYIQPVLEKSNRIGFCFSYPTEVSPELDGILLKWTKEIKATEVIGQFIGRGLIDVLGPVGVDKRIVLLNDTVATLLAGKATCKKPCDSYVGFILGTGTNIAYLEKNENILKSRQTDLFGSQAINVESGAFAKAPHGDIDIMLDRELDDPGSNRFEKMISGRYLPKIVFEALNKGIEGKLFGTSCELWIRSLEQLDHEQMDALIDNDRTDVLQFVGFSDVDMDNIRIIMKNVIERAAKLAAVNIAAAVIKTAGENSKPDISINIDGSAYYKTPGLRENTEKYLDKILGARNIRYTLMRTEWAPIIGAAIAGLVN